jgi:predicted metal-dependent peptidase
MKYKEAENQLRRARLALLDREWFFGTVALNLNLVADPTIPTYATDGRNLYYNPNLVLQESLQEVVTEVAHELGHIIYQHLTRRGDRDERLWNVAGDYVINDALVLSNFRRLKDWLHNVRYRGWTTDEVYNDLVRQQQSCQIDGQGIAGSRSKSLDEQKKRACDGIRELSEDQQKQLHEDLESVVASAVASAKFIGKFPGHLETLVMPLLERPTHWSQIVRDFAEEATRSDYTWQRPNKAYMMQGLYAPSLGGFQKRPFVIGVDTSGSMTDEILAECFASISDILEEIRPPNITVIQCDVQIEQVVEYTPDDLPLAPIKAYGRGGTRLRPIFDYIEEHSLEPSGCLIMTDFGIAADSYPKQEPDYPLLWVRPAALRGVTVQSPPYGMVVDMV